MTRKLIKHIVRTPNHIKQFYHETMMTLIKKLNPALKTYLKLSAIALSCSVMFGCATDTNNDIDIATPTMQTSDIETSPGDSYISDAFELNNSSVKYLSALDSLLFTIEVTGDVASVAPVPVGQVDGAPVLAYVFVTDLLPSDVGYNHVEGTVALAVTSHPDFDDTPLWNEDNNASYDDDGIIYHSHWVILESNELAAGGLAVVQATDKTVLTPTSPMAMYLDSPGFSVIEQGHELHVIVPLERIKRKTSFNTSTLTGYLEVDASGNAPLLKLEQVYTQLAGPFYVEDADLAPANALPKISYQTAADSFDIIDTSVDYISEIDSLIFTMDTLGQPAVSAPSPIGQVDGAPVFGYVFPTSIPVENVGFKNIENATLALAVTTHPDFDDTPLWDENDNNNYADDGLVYHTHWVALVADDDSGAGLSVPTATDPSNLPPTAPMAMYLDSPNFHAFVQGNKLKVIVPAQRINNVTQFNFDAVTAQMNVDASGEGPVLRVNNILDVLSGDLSLPYIVTEKLLTDF